MKVGSFNVWEKLTLGIIIIAFCALVIIQLLMTDPQIRLFLSYLERLESFSR